MVKVSSEFSLEPGRGNMPETSDMSAVVLIPCATGYQYVHVTRGRTRDQGTKANPTLHMPTSIANWGYPKWERRNRLWPQGLNIPHGYGASVVVRGG